MSPILRLTRRLAGLICRLMVGVLLFAQLATAAYACARTVDAALASGSPTVSVAAPCHQLDTDSPNLCVEHCRAGQQSADHASAPVLSGAVFALLYAIPAASDTPDPGHSLAAARDFALAAPPPPPHAVLHCCRRD